MRIAGSRLLQLSSDLLQVQAAGPQCQKSIEQFLGECRRNPLQRLLGIDGSGGPRLFGFLRLYVRLKFGMCAQEADVGQFAGSHTAQAQHREWATAPQTQFPPGTPAGSSGW